MTVCVAAMCATNILVGASDRMLTSGDVEFEPETPKILSLSNSCAIMIAGDASLQNEINQQLYKFVGDRIAATPEEWVPIGDIAREYQTIYQNMKSRRAEARVLKPLGLTLDSFIHRQREMSDSMVENLTKEIVNFDMPPIEAIISGVDISGAHIYVANNIDFRCQDVIGFAAIGAGYWHANSQFMFARHNRNRPVPETLLLTYAAKKRAEVAPGVGEGTDMFSIGPNLGSYVSIYSHVIEGLDEIYKRTRARSAQSIEKSNQEVNEYVEQLGKAATAQEQKAATPDPTEKTNGSERGGEEDSGTKKPN